MLPRPKRPTHTEWLLGGGGAAAALALVLLASRAGPHNLLPSKFGLAVLAAAKKQVGLSEDNGDAAVNAMLAAVGAPAESDWCAAAVASWVRQAASALGVAPPIAGSASVMTTVAQLRASPKAFWYSADALQASPGLVSAGMVVAWSRGGASSGLGHMGVVSSTQGGGRFTSVEGNAQGQAVVQNSHDLSAPSLLGMAQFLDWTIWGLS